MFAKWLSKAILNNLRWRFCTFTPGFRSPTFDWFEIKHWLCLVQNWIEFEVGHFRGFIQWIVEKIVS